MRTALGLGDLNFNSDPHSTRLTPRAAACEGIRSYINAKDFTGDAFWNSSRERRTKRLLLSRARNFLSSGELCARTRAPRIDSEKWLFQLQRIV